MKETRFIEQNKEKWVGFEKILKADYRDPEKLSEFFIKITDDLSYARTFYNNRSIRVYLNNICQQLFYLVYKSPKKSAFKGLANFWMRELPTIAYDARKDLLAALLIFLLAVSIGVVSSVHDPDFVRVILGDSYVSMTVENIESGDPMAVYKKMNEMDMFLGISLNNLVVSLRTFLMGILWAAGSVIILLYNGIMVGAFQYFFIEKGLFMESFLTIWLHGTLEMSAIVIAGASGLVLGRGVVAPASYSRLQSFQLAAKKGAKLFLGIVPIIVAAALIESFLTRYTDAPDALRLVLIVASFLFMLFYFAWYPYKVVKSGNAFKQTVSDLQSTPNFAISYHHLIKTGADILRDTFLFYRKFGARIIRTNVFFALLYLPVVAVFIAPDLAFFGHGFNYVDWMMKLYNTFFDYEAQPLLLPINSMFFGVYSWLILKMLYADAHPDVPLKRSHTVRYLVFNIVLSAAVSFAIFVGAWLNVLVSFLLSPVIALLGFALLSSSSPKASAVIKEARGYLRGNYGFLLGLNFLIGLVSIIGYFFLNSPFPLFYMDFLQWNVPLGVEEMKWVTIVMNAFFSMFATLVVFPVFLVGIAQCLFSFKEIHEANDLKMKIADFGK